MEPASGRQTAIRFPLGSILGEVEKRKILPVVQSDLKTLIIHKCPHTVDNRESGGSVSNSAYISPSRTRANRSPSQSPHSVLAMKL